MSGLLASLQHDAGALLGAVLIIVAMFLIARVLRLSQTQALTLALTPMAVALAFDRAILPALALV
ncbi:hypothetical protein [Devosia sp.]|uniref:hypothetical protein n=1 Tax=Devosia sp. TaxID=1871048 RepID=UPI003A8EA632